MSSNWVDMSTIPGTVGSMDEWLSEREERAWRALQFMQMRLDAALARQLAADSGLSYPDYMVLVALTDSTDGTLRQHELSKVLGWEKSRTSHQVGRMEGRGLVRKVRSDADRRATLVAVTDKGRSELAAAAPGHVGAVRRLFIDQLTEEQIEVIADAAETVLAAFDDPAPPASS